MSARGELYPKLTLLEVLRGDVVSSEFIVFCCDRESADLEKLALASAKAVELSSVRRDECA